MWSMSSTPTIYGYRPRQASVTIRSATPADAEFLTDMLVEAVNWEP
jgi:hypothetical protein